MTGRLEYLRDFKPVSEGGFVTFGNDFNGKIMGNGVLTNGNFTILSVWGNCATPVTVSSLIEDSVTSGMNLVLPASPPLQR